MTRDEAMIEAFQRQWCAWCKAPIEEFDVGYPFCSRECFDQDWNAYVEEQSDPHLKLL